jgi:YNFM family putative membrane transporter
MSPIDRLPLQAVVFLVAAAAFSSVYITQPVLPVLVSEFGASAFEVSLTVSAVILGIAISILPLGILSDHAPVHRILLTGGLIVAVCCVFAAVTHSLWALVAVRFVQGLFIPTLTTCMVTYLARSLPAHKLNVVMGSYVSATVAGGLGGRLLGGWLHPPAHWRYAFVTSAVLIVITTLLASRRLREPAPAVQHLPGETGGGGIGLWSMLARPDLLRLFLVAFASFFVFSSVFNFLPFYLAAPPVSLPLQFITALYLTYVIGIVIGPLAGRANDRFGNGLTMSGGALLVMLGLLLSLWPSLVAIGLALAAVCAGYFGVHASAVGTLNLRLSVGRGRANALYVLFYYAGGFGGITVSGFAYSQGGWTAVVLICIAVLTVPAASGLLEHRSLIPRHR